MMIKLAVLLSAAVFHGGVLGASPNCDVARFDSAAGDIIFFGAGTKIASTASDLDKSCNDQYSSLKVAQDYAEGCVTGLGQGMVKLFLEGAATEVSLHCSPGAGRDEYLKMIPCILTHATQLYKCNKQLAGILEAASGQAKKHRVPVSCCSVGKYKECITKAAGKCSPEHFAYAEKVIDNYAGDLLSTVCLKYKPGSKECKTLPRVAPAASPKHKTLLPPLAQVLSSLST